MKPHSCAREIEALVAGRHGDPFAFLGMHESAAPTPAGAAAGIVVRAFLPDAAAMAVVDAGTGQVVAYGERVDPAGLFVAVIAGRRGPFRYRLRVRWSDGREDEFEDIYRFPPVLGDLDLHLLVEGNHLASYQKLGAHPIVHDGVHGVAFAVWAPHAQRVSVVGDFNRWDGRRMPMRKRHAGGFWEIFVPGLRPGHLYKYELLGPDGALLPLKADPYAAQAEPPPSTASVIAGPARHQWRDEGWMAERARRNDRSAPISIYEVHLGSWRRNGGGGYLTYRELAEQLVPYAADLGFTHIEVLPVTEYPFDGSWGYQPISLFAPTSRYGSPDDFRAFVDACHAAGLGLWLDWVPGHFPSDAHGLGRFDGTALYEHADPRQGLHRDWNTLIYNFGRREVANFLLSSALAWLREYHIDGLRVDAVASMLYLDYSRNEGDWIANRYGGRENLEAIDFLRRMNELVFGDDDAAGATTAAEESTAWPMVSRPTYVGGLGFGFKWNMGWMHDTLGYMAVDPIHRKYHHNNLTFGLLYAYHENFILPLSHDEVVHGKGSLIGRMPGDTWQRFANLRVYFAFMWTQPGKKLLFMGGEFGQDWEWDHDRGLDWAALDHPLHAGVQTLVRDLNRLYRTIPALHRFDCDPQGFSWIDVANAEESVLSYLRRGTEPRDVAVVVCNFTPVPRYDYRIGVPFPGRYIERINTDAQEYGGSGVGNSGWVEAEPRPMHGHGYSVRLALPPLAALVLTPEG